MAVSRPPPRIWAQLSRGLRELSADDEDIRQGEQAENLLAFLVQSTIAGSGIAELALDNPEDVLDLLAVGRHQPVDPALLVGQVFPLLAFERVCPDDIIGFAMRFWRTLFIAISAVPKGDLFLAMEECISHDGTVKGMWQAEQGANIRSR